MRYLALFLATLSAVASSSAAPRVRVVSWELEGRPGVGLDQRSIGQLAAQLQVVQADVIVLYGISDPNTARRLAELLKPGPYRVAAHTTFRKSGPGSPASGPSVTLLSRDAPLKSQVIEWRSTGQLDASGGFAFLLFGPPENSFCVYSAQWPEDNLRAPKNAAGKLSPRKSELASQYLTHHLKSVESTLSNPVPALLISASSAPDAAMDGSAGSIRFLEQSGFEVAFAPPGPAASGNGRDAAAPAAPANGQTQTRVLARHLRFTAPPQTLAAGLSFRPMIACDFTPGTIKPAAAWPGAAYATALWQKMSAFDLRQFWPWIVGLAALLLFAGVTFWFVRQGTVATSAFRQPAGGTTFVRLSPFSGNSEKLTPPLEAETHPRWRKQKKSEAEIWSSPGEPVKPAKIMPAPGTTALAPHLGRLLRDRLIGWLSSQRTELLLSHEAGTRQVIQLEEQLQRIQGQLQDRLKGHEQRIAELEREIVAKEKVIRDLLRAQARMASEIQPG